MDILITPATPTQFKLKKMIEGKEELKDLSQFNGFHNATAAELEYLENIRKTDEYSTKSALKYSAIASGIMLLLFLIPVGIMALMVFIIFHFVIPANAATAAPNVANIKHVLTPEIQQIIFFTIFFTVIFVKLYKNNKREDSCDDIRILNCKMWNAYEQGDTDHSSRKFRYGKIYTDSQFSKKSIPINATVSGFKYIVTHPEIEMLLIEENYPSRKPYYYLRTKMTDDEIRELEKEREEQLLDEARKRKAEKRKEKESNM